MVRFLAVDPAAAYITGYDWDGNVEVASMAAAPFCERCVSPLNLSFTPSNSPNNPPQPLLQRGRRHCHRQHVKRRHYRPCFYRVTREREAHGSYYTCACFV